MLGVTSHHNHVAPLTMHKEEIMMDITAPSTEKGKTANLDLVVVLDTSNSMNGQKLQDMKKAANFVIQKVGAMDTLTFVPFSSKVEMPSAMPPEHMSSSAKQKASRFVQNLTAHGNTNMKEGLKKALDILHGRTDKTGRAAGVFLMSDGKQNVGDAKDVDVHEFPVFTFGFGQNHDHHLLHDIALGSHGGTYHNTPHGAVGSTLLGYFAKMLGIIRDFSALNVAVTLEPHAGATLLHVDPGQYRATNGNGGSITIYFGDLARREQRRIFAEVQLPAVHNNEHEKTVLAIKCSYRPAKVREITESLDVRMSRDRSASPHAHGEDFEMELARRKHARHIERMKKHADKRQLDMAMDELSEAKNALSRIKINQQHIKDQVDALSMEIEHLDLLLGSETNYTKGGAAYMLAAMLSHGRQRFAARGGADDVKLYDKLSLMVMYTDQAQQFHTIPNAHI